VDDVGLDARLAQEAREDARITGRDAAAGEGGRALVGQVVGSGDAQPAMAEVQAPDDLEVR